MEPATQGRVVMANHPNLYAYLRSALEWEFAQGGVDLRLVRNFVSSPRLMSFRVKLFSHPALSPAGNTYLDKRTMLADFPQKTYAVAFHEWKNLVDHVVFVDKFAWRDASIMNIQVWPYTPASLDEFAMTIAVALSYTPVELMAESRISLALDELVHQWGFFSDEF
ncbi:TPA: hypothetical protein ACRNTS_004626 [Pseudomonas aeruginosa]|uniref:hypothetical protein n=1 Tax=Pseudomonas aeruginosa TaxID=287 RepID=UPI000F835842|nr:hypothetical protein [Pseudomonas aeruginosa]MBG4156477.1 hypothetical protein [Pseudomonas aeruginosa]MBG4168773.1 hypothetical protein [Pseudomonas aeruginosa]MBG4487283.1 hypothetical protein [Pseudomonas aeruginosa]MBG4499698.1 hypothetical protein [Pseudomonas aeruginosa]RTR70082.1 hypothetical protein DY933_28735 [Pseudomonas aeruginosa]